MKKYYTEKQYKELLSHLVILCQTNEQVNDHILNWFDAHNVRYRQKSIGEGDYGFMIEAAPELASPLIHTLQMRFLLSVRTVYKNWRRAYTVKRKSGLMVAQNMTMLSAGSLKEL